MNINELQTIEHDILVIGAGGAGLRAAIECSAKGITTLNFRFLVIFGKLKR